MPEENKEEKLESFKDEIKRVLPSESKKEKLGFLKREDIRTMQKDIRKLREIEAKKERERIAAIRVKTKDKPEPKPVLPSKPKPELKIPPKPKPEIKPLPKETLIPKPPKKPSPFRKVLVRVMFFLIGIALVVFSYWLLGLAKINLKDIFFPEKEPPQKEKPVELPEITSPPSFFLVEKTSTFEITENLQMFAVLGQLTKQELPENNFVRLIIKNTKENRLVTLEDIAQTFQIEVPEEIFQTLKTDSFNIFVYPQKEGKRVLVIAKIAKRDKLNELLINWETKIAQEGISVAGKKIPTLASSFKSYAFTGTSFRYLSISKDDLGICYALLGDYFVLTNSFGSMEEVIEKLQPPTSSGLEDKIGQLFIVGFQEKTVTPKLQDFFKKYKPGGVLLLSKNIESREQLKSLIENLQSLSQKETGLPLFIAVDQEGGLISRIGFLEEKTPQSEIKSTDGAYNIGLKRGEELKELGVNLNLTPVLDDMQEGDFYFNRTFQKTSDFSGELAKSLILGQKDSGILTAIKHFPGYVGIPFNPEAELATINLPEISQFKKAMEANPKMVMASNAVYKEIDSSLPFTFSTTGVQFLKNNLGSEVLIMADDLAQNSLLKNFSLRDIVVKPIQAGIDILIFSGWRISVEQGLDTFLAAVRNKEISETQLQEAISKIVNLKESF